MKKRSLGLILAISLTMPTIFLGTQASFARGGCGGFRGGGGFRSDDFRGADFRGDGEMRSDFASDFDRGFDHPFDDHSAAASGFDQHFANTGLGHDDRPDAFNNDSSARANPADNGIRNYDAQRSLASDGGFSSVFKPATRAGLANQTVRMSTADLSNQARVVRSNFNYYGAFGHNWWANHPNSWWQRGWDDSWAWRWGSWGEFAPWWGLSLGVLPVYYDYGDNINYDDNGNVDYGNQVVASASDYYQQAQDLATSNYADDDFGSSAAAVDGPPPAQNGGGNLKQGLQAEESVKKTGAAGGEWKPFGVYSLVQGGQLNSATIFQLCSNKKGQIKGNYYNCLTNETMPVTGSIDKKNMRAAWVVGKDKNVVYDSGVANLLKDQSPILIHFGKDSTQQWTLVRIKNQNDKNSK